MSFVYLLVHAYESRFKVGVSNSPIKRAKELQEQINMDGSYKIQVGSLSDAYRLEKTLHFIFQANRLDIQEVSDGYTEWFSIDALPEVIRFVQENAERVHISEVCSLLPKTMGTKHLIPGSVLEINNLADLATNLTELLNRGTELQRSGVRLRVRESQILPDTVEVGETLLSTLANLKAWENSLIIDRTRSGRQAAKAKGVKFGPPPTLTPEQIAHARALVDQEGRTVKEAAALLGVHRSTLYRAFNKESA